MINFFVSGIPKGQARPRFFRRGKFVGTYSPKTDFFRICYYEAEKHKPEIPLNEPLILTLRFYLPRPKSCKKRLYPIVKPDLDNLIKAVLDAMTQAGFWRDDSLICSLIATKQYSMETGVEIIVEVIDKP